MIQMEPSRLIQEAGQFFSQFEWQLFATLTFDHAVSENKCNEHISTYVNRLGRSNKLRTYALWMPERSLWEGRWHAHALIGADGPLTARCSVSLCGRCATHTWSKGFAEIKRYEPGRGGIYYLLKELGRRGRSFNLENHEAMLRVPGQLVRPSESTPREGVSLGQGW
jgi:hypothetical protein